MDMGNLDEIHQSRKETNIVQKKSDEIQRQECDLTVN